MATRAWSSAHAINSNWKDSYSGTLPLDIPGLAQQANPMRPRLPGLLTGCFSSVLSSLVSDLQPKLNDPHGAAQTRDLSRLRRVRHNRRVAHEKTGIRRAKIRRV